MRMTYQHVSYYIAFMYYIICKQHMEQLRSHTNVHWHLMFTLVSCLLYIIFVLLAQEAGSPWWSVWESELFLIVVVHLTSSHLRHNI